MAFLQNINEGLRTLFGSKKATGAIQVADKGESKAFTGMNQQALFNLISILRSPINERKELYEVLQQMMNDSIVGAAVELVASDATQIDKDKGHTCWAVVKEDTVATLDKDEDGNIKKLKNKGKKEKINEEEQEIKLSLKVDKNQNGIPDDEEDADNEPVDNEPLDDEEEEEDTENEILDNKGRPTGDTSNQPIIINVADRKKAEVKEETEVVKVVNDFLVNILEIDEHLYSWAFQLVGYGEFFLRTYYSDIDDAKRDKDALKNKKLLNGYGKLFDLVENPLDVKDITEFGDTVGYLYHDRDMRDKLTLYTPKDFIHVMNDQKLKREKALLRYVPRGKDVEVEQLFKVKYGTSYIESAREAFEILQLLELILIVSRFNHSALYRLFKIEVGGASRLEVNNILSEFKRAIQKSEAINIPGKEYKAKDQALPYGGNVYIPTKNGKGDVNVETVGNDYQLREILDLDYYQNKLFAALKIPKAYLGVGDDNMSGIGNNSLLRMDIRYSRQVKSVIAVLKQGIKTVCDYYLYSIGMGDYCDDYDIEMANVLTADEMDSINAMNDLANGARSVLDLFGEAPCVSKDRLYAYLCDKMLDSKGMWEYIRLSDEELEAAKNAKDKDDNDSKW